MHIDDLSRRIDFLREIDRLKSVIRQSPLLDASRKENSAEHSWHLAMYALVLADYATGAVDITRVMKMLLIHDIVEVDAGDMPIHGASNANQMDLEQQAAARIFGLLPDAANREFSQLWREFEAAESDEAQFAKALDRFQPLLVNVFTQGGTWSENHVRYEQVLERYGPTIQRGAPVLWELAHRWVASHFSVVDVTNAVT
ncbi:HD domain-containing protein [Pseudoduganella sp. FT26W]|uniref:HD domain-containing protein n=1 Tax=Duganella aquatilis TaxID=2666082 RepID=A0A844CRV2_9BURK|nr:HD domain-containing protein [Duganella aquatilis]MRW82658.1 HD domain-containing protein [Duganella aquatilis]